MNNNEDKHCYIGYCNNQEVYLKSSSGGAFAALALNVLSAGGAVYGAMVDCSEKISCKHICVESVEDLSRIQGSKYMASELGHVFDDVRVKLHTGRHVLFSGTSCQVAALKSFLKEDYENLVTVDLICHGVPKKGIVEDYIDYLESKYECQINGLSFRRKDKGHCFGEKMPFILTLKCKDIGQERMHEKLIPLRESAFYRLYMAKGGYRESCYSCHYANAKKPADITLGDYYLNSSGSDELGMNKYDPSRYYSCIITHSEKGYDLLKQCGSDLEVYEIPVEKAIKEHEQLRTPSSHTAMGDKLYSCYQKNGFASVQRYIDRKNYVIDIAKKVKNLFAR